MKVKNEGDAVLKVDAPKRMKVKPEDIDKAIMKIAKQDDERGQKVKAIIDRHFYGNVVRLVDRWPIEHKAFLMESLGIEEEFDVNKAVYNYYVVENEEELKDEEE